MSWGGQGGLGGRGGRIVIGCRPFATGWSCQPIRAQRFRTETKTSRFLLKELDSLRDLNAKLQEQLLQKQKELQRKDLNDQLRQNQNEQQIWSKTTELVEQLMEAQKEREQAMMSRLLLANEERDQALLTAQRLSQAAANQ
ncbi:hypothetical protein WMY93_033298 [Mugilogobius chulae]|uniref:Uncharacterized protein n=1 Tax=Mugilogobius chulae TaxID=88201 RepID=A0AAW0MP92_9GOBI